MRSLQKSLLAAGFLSVFSTSVSAEGFYVGINAGQASYDASLDDFVFFLDDGSLSSSSLDDSDSSIRLTLGYQLNPSVSLEGGFVDLGEMSFKSTSDGSGFYVPGRVSFSLAVDGLFFDVKGSLPMNEKFDLYGKVGLLMWDVEGTLADSAGSFTVDDDGNDLFIGLGASYNINMATSLNIDYTFYDLDGDEVDAFTVGIQLGF